MSVPGRDPHHCLTDPVVRQARRGRHADGNLYQYIRQAGRWLRSRLQRLVIKGKATAFNLGPYPLVSLVEALRCAAQNRRIARAGADPRKSRAETATPTVRSVVAKVVEVRRGNGCDPDTEETWARMFDEYVYPSIGDTSIRDVALDDVASIITPLWNGRGSLGYVLCQYLEHVFDWAQAHGHRPDNPPARLRVLLPTVKTVVRPYPSLPYARIADAMAAVRASDADEALKLLLVFLVLCASRFSEAAEARWSEIDTERRVWTLPPNRTKAVRQHLAPLSDQVLDILACARSLERPQPFVFPVGSGPRAGSPATSHMLSRLLASLNLFDENGESVVVHGFRSTFRVWAAEQTDVKKHVCEAALAHAHTGPPGAAYERTDYFDDRVKLMQRWADHVLPPPDTRGRGFRPGRSVPAGRLLTGVPQVDPVPSRPRRHGVFGGLDT